MSGNEISGGAISPPPGVTPDLVNPPDHKIESIILHTVCLTLVTIAVGVRLYTRALITRKIGADDCVALFAWAMTVSFSGVLLAANTYGIGRHIWDIPASWFITGLKLLFVVELLYIPIAFSIKIAFLLFFDRIFAVSARMKWLTRGAMAANFIFYIITWFKSILLCNPIQRSYNPSIPGHCGAEDVLPYVTGVWGFLSDFYLLILPIYCVWNLNVKSERKWKLIVTFSVGLFACIASIIRFAYTVQLINDFDVTWNFSKLSLWTVLEINVGLICACLPAIPAFIDRYFASGFGLSSYFSHFKSYISGTRGSKGSSYITPLTSHKSTAHSNDDVVEGNYTSLDEAASASYDGIGDRTRAPTGMRHDMSWRKQDHPAKITTKDEDIEAWVPEDRVGKFAGNDFPMQDLNA